MLRLDSKLFKGLLFGLVLYLTCFFAVLLFGMPVWLLAHQWYPRLGRRCMDFFFFLWFVLCAALVELLLGVRIVVHGHPAPAADSTLIVCNHRTRLDWLFLMAYQLRCGSLSHYRISLKQSLKNIPGPGWAMQLAGFVFLKRDWSEDQARITRSLQYFARTRTRPQFLLFPEGTDLTDNNLSKSRAFAEKHGLPVYRHVLHPRTTGFVHFVNRMRKNKILDSVLDITVAYPRDVAQTEADLVLGRAPQEIHFLARSFRARDLPDSGEELEDFCRQLWREKEAILEEYHELKTFTGPGGEPAEAAVTPDRERWARRMMLAALVFWSVFLCGVGAALVWLPAFRWLCVGLALMNVIISKFFDGVDRAMFASAGCNDWQ